MILFVFEGDEREPRLYRTLERLYFPKVNDNIICSFGNNIYDLYNELKEYEDGGDIVSVMRERLAARGDSILNGIRSSDISEIFLFFDYDFQHSHLSLEEINQRVEEMLALFAGGGNLENMPTATLTDEQFMEDKIDILGILVAGGLAASRSEARRAVEQGGVSVKGEKVADIKKTYTKDEIAAEEFIVKKGKKSFKKIVVE